MTAVVVYAHPSASSYTAAVLDRVRLALLADDAPVTVIDLWAEGFDPLALPRTVSDAHLGALRQATTLVLVYPTWWSGQPAILTGWLGALPADALRSVERLVAVTSHGSSKWVNMLEGETGRRIVHRVLRRRCAPKARVEWIALYGIDRAGERQRLAFLERVGREL